MIPTSWISARFFTAGGTNYTYNGKTYSFNSGVVTEYDVVCQKFANAGCNVVMIIKIPLILQQQI